MNPPLTSPPNSAGLAQPDAGLLARLVHASPAVMYSCKVAGDFGTIAVTANVCALLGYEAADFISDPSFWAVRIHPEDSGRVFEEMSRLLREDRQVILYRMRHAAGHYVAIQDHMTLERDEDGTPTRLLGCWLPVSGHQAAGYFAARMESDSTETTRTESTGGSYAEPT